MFKNHQSRASIAVALALLGSIAFIGCAPVEEVADSVETEIPITTESKAALALYLEGQYLLDVGRGVEARDKFKTAIAEDPGFVRAHLNQSNAALSFKEFQDSLDAAAAHLDGASEGERLLVEINRSFLTNDNESGLEAAQELVASYPESARAAMALAGMQATMNDNEGARESLSRALDLDPASAGALYTLANNYLFGEPRDFEMAESYASQMQAAFPEEAKVHELMGDIKRAQNDLEAARISYNQAADADPTLAVAQHKKGHVNSFLGNIDEARAAYDAGIEAAKPENKAGYAVFKTFTRIHEGNIQAALEEMEALAAGMEAMGTPADQLKGQQTFAMNSHSLTAMHAGMLDQAAKSVAKGNELRMAIAQDVGTDDAKRLQEAACHQWDGLLAAYKGDLDGAADHAEAIAELVAEDRNPRRLEGYHYVLGMAALKAGDSERAAEHLRQANFKNNMFIRYHLALAEEAVGNAEAAQQMFSEVGSYNFNSVGFALVGRDAAARAAG